MGKPYFKGWSLKLLISVASTLIIAVSVLSIIKPSVELAYIGTDNIAKNWFLKGEEVKMYFNVFSPTLTRILLKSI